MSLIIFDLDGTLAPVGMPIPETIAAGLRRLEGKGHKVALCSGKPLGYLCGMLRQVGLQAPAMVGENGAAVQLGVDLPPEHYSVLSYPIEARQALGELRMLMEERFGGEVWFQPNEHMLTCFPKYEGIFEPIAQLIDSFEAEQKGLTVYRHCDCFDIIPKDTNKGAGVRELCRMLGEEPEECVAVGDHCNDLPMFRVVGLAIAVGGYAPDEANVRFQHAEEAIEYLLSGEKNATL